MKNLVQDKQLNQITITSSKVFFKYQEDEKEEPTIELLFEKPDNKCGRWTSTISEDKLIDGLIPFNLRAIRLINDFGNDLIISKVMYQNKFPEELIINIDDIINSPKKIGEGYFTQVLFDQDFKHLK